MMFPEFPRAAIMARIFSALFLFILLCPTFSCAAASPPLVLTDDGGSFPLAGHIDVLEDKTGKLTIGTISSPEKSALFKPDHRPVLNFGVSTSVYWLRFTIFNPSAAVTKWLLELNYPHMDYLDLYVPRQGGGFDIMPAGDMRPMRWRQFRHRNPVFPLDIGASGMMLYLRADPRGRAVMPLTLWRSDAFTRMDNQRYLVNGCYFGAMLMMVVYNLLLFFSLRDRNYLYYILDIFSFALYIFFVQGFLLEFVSGDMPWVNRYALAIPGLVIFFGVVFCRKFLETRRNAPFVDHVLKIILVASVAAVPVVFVLPPKASSLVMAALSVGSSVTGLAAGILCHYRRVHSARYYLAARIFRAMGVYTFVLSMYNLVPRNMATSSLQAGSILEALLFSFALSDRISVMQREREEARGEAVRSSQLASLGQLAAGVAHEINTPINTIINSAELLLEDADRGSLEHDAEVIKKQGLRIAGIVKSLLFFSRLPTKDAIPFDVAEMLHGVLDMIGAQLRKGHIALKTAIPADLPDVLVRPQQMEQVFLNILTNAMHALEERHGDAADMKRIEISASAVRINQRPFVRMVFSDNGAGIPETLLKTVTEPFVTTRQGGTGLGLSICRQIMKEHGGDITLESKAGKFTQVSIELPVVGLA